MDERGTSPFELLGVVLLSLAAIGVALLPLGAPASRLAMPDMLLAVVSAWVLRKPAAAPLLMILAIGLFADFLTMRPIGLGALILLLVTENLRRQSDPGLYFLNEWMIFAAITVLAITAEAIATGLLLFASPDPLVIGARLLATVAFYPVAVFLVRLAGIRRTTEGSRR